MPKISSLSNTATVVNSNDWFVIEQGGVTKKVAAQYVSTGSGGGGGGGGGTSKVSISSAALGGVTTGSLSFFTVSSVCNRGIISKMTIVPQGTDWYDIEIYDAGSQTANKMLIAYQLVGEYTVTIPWFYEAASGDALRVGIRNLALSTRSYYLKDLRVEKFA